VSDIYCQRLLSKNDTNGNPRRIVVVYGRHTGEPLGVFDEGNAGVPRAFIDATGHAMEATWLPDVQIQPTEYRRWLREETAAKPYISIK